MAARRFSPRGPLGLGPLLLGALDAQSLADNLPHGISLNACALFVGLCEAPLCLRDYLAFGGGVRRLSLNDCFAPIRHARSCAMLPAKHIGTSAAGRQSVHRCNASN